MVRWQCRLCGELGGGSAKCAQSPKFSRAFMMAVGTVSQLAWPWDRCTQMLENALQTSSRTFDIHLKGPVCKNF